MGGGTSHSGTMGGDARRRRDAPSRGNYQRAPAEDSPQARIYRSSIGFSRQGSEDSAGYGGARRGEGRIKAGRSNRGGEWLPDQSGGRFDENAAQFSRRTIGQTPCAA